MFAEPLSQHRSRYHIPLDHIAETRARFDPLRISYEVDLVTANPWLGLEVAARAFRSTGLSPLALRLTRNGVITCKLADSPAANFQALDAAFATAADLDVVGWTTVIESH